MYGDNTGLMAHEEKRVDVPNANFQTRHWRFEPPFDVCVGSLVLYASWDFLRKESFWRSAEYAQLAHLLRGLFVLAGWVFGRVVSREFSVTCVMLFLSASLLTVSWHAGGY